MKTITEHELRDGFAAVMRAVEAGEAYRITRRGTVVAELRPPRRPADAETVVAHHRVLPQVDATLMRGEADTFFGSADRVTDADPWARPPG